MDSEAARQPRLNYGPHPLIPDPLVSLLGGPEKAAIADVAGVAKTRLCSDPRPHRALSISFS